VEVTKKSCENKILNLKQQHESEAALL
jgi:hypothetical protein